MVLEDNNCRIRLIFNEAAAAKGLSVASLATGFNIELTEICNINY
jgi:hypothetical protein